MFGNYLLNNARQLNARVILTLDVLTQLQAATHLSTHQESGD